MTRFWHQPADSRFATGLAVLLAPAALALAACGGASDGSGAAQPAGVLNTPPAARVEQHPLGTATEGERVDFVTTPTTTTSTLPPTTTSTTTTTTTLAPTTTTSTTTSTTTTTLPSAVRCSFAADALFAPGSAELADGAAESLIVLAADVLANDGDVRAVTVEGRTDFRGSDEDNRVLSEARARAAAGVLITAGIHADLVSTVGRGEQDARQPDGSSVPDDAELSADRRVDIVIDADLFVSDCG